MRVGIEKALDAFRAGTKANTGNDVVRANDNNDTVWYYYGTAIARRDTATRTIYLSMQGFPTKSTMERLNAILCDFGNNDGDYFNTVKGKHFFGNREITDKEVIEIHY